MQKFRWRDDVEAWLKPMNYEQFWHEIRPHCLVMYRREECDAQIAKGLATTQDVLAGLKIVAASLLGQRHQLKRKPTTPWLRIVTDQD